MDAYMPRRIRSRNTPNKKWTIEEEKSIIDYIKRNLTTFEKPKAQTYYRKFMEETGFDSDWKLIRAKVTNMRYTFEKAQMWMKELDPQTFGNNETIRDVLLKKCPLYDDFFYIFGQKLKRNSISSFDSDSYQSHRFSKISKSENNDLQTETEDEYKTRSMLNFTDGNDVEDDDDDDNDDDLESSLQKYDEDKIAEQLLNDDIAFCFTPPQREYNERSSSSSVSGVYSATTSVSDHLEIKAKILQFQKEKWQQERIFKDKEIQLKRERLQLERAKLKQELRLRTREVEYQQKLKIMELEMKERIAMREIEFKMTERNQN